MISRTSTFSFSRQRFLYRYGCYPIFAWHCIAMEDLFQRPVANAKCEDISAKCAEVAGTEYGIIPIGTNPRHFYIDLFIIDAFAKHAGMELEVCLVND